MMKGIVFEINPQISKKQQKNQENSFRLRKFYGA